MSLEEWELNVQGEKPMDFISLAHHGCDLRDIYQAQDLMDYFGMLNGPTYLTLVRHFWVRAQIYNLKASKLEMDEKVLIDPSLQGKTKEEMGLEPFRREEIRSSIMGIHVVISVASIAWVIRRASERKFVYGLDNNKKSPWKSIVNKTMFNSTTKGKYSELSMRTKKLLKIPNENLLPKGSGGDQPSLDHKVFLHFFLTKQKANVPKYIFRHMIKNLKESQTINRNCIPYGRLILEILHQGRILNALKEVNYFTHAQLSTVTGKIINGGTLKHMKLINKEDHKVLSTDLKESSVISNLMDDFPPICKQDPLEVRVMYMKEYFEKTGQTIKISDIPDEMYGGALPIAKSRRSKKREMTEAEYFEDAPEQVAKKAKVSKATASQPNPTASDVLSIQQEAQELDASEVLDKRPRSKKQVDSVNVIEIESDTSSPNQSSDSSDLDDATLSLIYKISASSKTPQKATKSVPKKIDLVNQQPQKPTQQNNPEPSSIQSITQTQEMTIPESVIETVVKESVLVTESEPSVSIPDSEPTQNLPLTTTDQPSSSSNIQILEQPPLNLLESEFIETELLKISKDMQDLVHLRRVPTLSIDYEDQWASLKNRASELLDVVSQKCIRIQAAEVKRHLRALHLAAKAKAPFFPELDYMSREARVFKMLKQKVLQQQAESKAKEDSLLQRQIALEETVKQQAEVIKKQAEDFAKLMALLQQQQKSNP